MSRLCQHDKTDAAFAGSARNVGLLTVVNMVSWRMPRGRIDQAWNVRKRSTRKLHEVTSARSELTVTGAWLSLGEAAVEDRGEFVPVLLVWSELEPALDAARDQRELAVVDAVDEDDAGVRALRSRPVAQNPREVGDVVCDEDPLLARGERENLVVVQALERALLIERTHVMAGLLEPASHVGPGDVGVEQQAS